MSELDPQCQKKENNTALMRVFGLDDDDDKEEMIRTS